MSTMSDVPAVVADGAAGPALPIGSQTATEPVPWVEIGPSTGWSALNLRELWSYRDLLLVLAARDVKLRYRQTALGVVWVVLQPLLAAGIFSFVFGKVLKAPSDGVPYFVFSFAGLLAYNAFSGTLTRASACIVGNAPLISKIFFPRLILPLSTSFATLIDFAVGLGLMIVLLCLSHITPGWGILLLPVWLSLIIALAVGAGLYTSALMVQYRDLQYVIPVLTNMILYATPIMYSISAIPQKLKIWVQINPLTGLIEGFRWSLLGTKNLDWAAVAYSVIFVVAAVVFGAFSFKKMERHFADVI
jgi:lipopolysaccharide transport system permease protein